MAPSHAPFLALLSAVLAASTSPARATTTDTVVQSLVATTKGEVNYAYWFRRLYGAEVSEREVACMRNSTVLHAQSGACAWLFEQGPCSAREWLVAEKSNAGLRVVCRRRPCAPEYFFTDEGSCVPKKDVCAGKVARFRYSLSGSGRCQCVGFHATGPDGVCHLAYSQGPCRTGQVLAPSYSGTLQASRGVCTQSLCPAGEVSVEPDSGGAAPQCSVLGLLDCSAMMVPLMDPLADVHVPLCDDPIRNSIKVPTRPSFCLRDNHGRCVRSLVHSPQPYDWSVEAEDDGDKLIFSRSAAGASAVAPDFLTRYLWSWAFLVVLGI